MNADTLAVRQTGEQTLHKKTAPFNVKRIIESLPENATPSQQDSAVQANLPQRPSFRSTQPDTLNLPGWNIPKSKTDYASLPLYYQENFFKKDSLYHPELPYNAQGMIGQPLPYQLRYDDWITGILLFCFFVMISIFSKSRKLILQMMQDFFFAKPEHSSTVTEETGREKRETIFLLFQTSLLISLFFFDYTQYTADLSIGSMSSHTLLAIYVGICLIYFAAKHILYRFINWIFFNKQQHKSWTRAYYFLLSTEGVLLFPLAMLTVYFNTSLEKTALIFLILLFIVKILLFYKYFSIFFPKFYGFLHLIVYFCALEILPTISAWQALLYTNDIFIIKF